MNADGTRRQHSTFGLVQFDKLTTKQSHKLHIFDNQHHFRNITTMMSIRTATLTVCMMALANVEGFTVAPQTTSSSVASSRTSELFMAKGFGAKPVEKKEKSEGQIKREQERSKYDEIAGTGGNEYSTWLKSNNILQTTLVPFSHHCLL